MLGTTAPNEDEWKRLYRSMKEGGFHREFNRIRDQTVALYDQQRLAGISDWNPPYEWGIEQMKLCLGEPTKSHPMTGAAEYDDIIASQEAMDKLK